MGAGRQQFIGAAQVGATGAQQLGAAGAQQRGAGAQQLGAAGAQQLSQHFFLQQRLNLGIFHLQHLGWQQLLQLGAGAQQVGAGAQQPWSASSSEVVAQQNRMAAVKAVHFIMEISWLELVGAVGFLTVWFTTEANQWNPADDSRRHSACSEGLPPLESQRQIHKRFRPPRAAGMTTFGHFHP